jgi:hypothetical protein
MAQGYYEHPMQASVSLQSFSGDLKLVSNSFQEYKFTEQGLHKTAKQQPTSASKFYEVKTTTPAHHPVSGTPGSSHSGVVCLQSIA